MKLRTKLILLFLISLLLTNLNCNSQNWLDKSKNEIIKKISKDKSYSNLIIKEDTIYYTMNIDNKFYSSETRYFRNDSCYKYISNTNITNYSTEVKVLQELFGVPLIGTNWSYMKDGIYRVITVEIIDDNSITTMTSYKDYKEYTNTIHFILNPTEYE